MPEKIINSGIVLMDNSEETLLASVKDAEKELYKEISKIFENLDITNGKIASSAKAEEFLLKLDSIIRTATKKAGYNASVAKFVKDFDKVEANVKEIQSQINSINITSAQIAPVKNIEIANTLEVLLGNKFSASFIAPLQQALYRNVMLGATVADTEQYLRDYLISSKEKDSKLLRYIKQVSRDSVSQFDGSLQANIASELSLNAVRYVGSIILDSRAQCRKWVDTSLITLDDLFQAEIDKAINGTLYYEGKKSSGMYADTNVANFVVYRGGYNCRHRAIPTLATNKIIGEDVNFGKNKVSSNTVEGAKIKAEDWVSTLPAKEKKIVKDYTSNFAYKVNAFDRTGAIYSKDYTAKEFTDFSTQLSQTLETAPVYEGIVHRGLKFDTKDNFKLFASQVTENSLFVDKAFMSASLDKKVAENFANESGFGTVYMKIYSKNGVLIEDISNISGEKEILFNKLSKFVVESRKEIFVNGELSSLDIVLREL